MLGLLLCGTGSAQVNFFECAKNPAKCRPPPSSATSQSRSADSELDRARLEEELRQKITAELERREKERIQTEESERARLEEELRRKFTAELERREKERIEAEESERARLGEELRRKITAELESRERERRQTKVANVEPAKPMIDKSIRIATLPHKKALIIGNDTYEFVAKLQNARADARAMAKSLSDLGYQVTLKTDLPEKGMRAAVRQFKETVNSGDEVLFFYAGHGLQLGGTNYLLPTDIKGESEDQVKDEAMQLQRLLDDMSEKNAKFTLALIDACRDNPFPRRGRTIGGRGLAPTTAASGQMIIFSAGSGQQALDKVGPEDRSPNGLFTRMLLEEMYAPGTRVDNVVREVRKRVVEVARSIGHEQVPAIYDQVVGDFYFIPPR